MIQYAIPSYVDGVVPWAWWDGGFTEPELNLLQQKAKDVKLTGSVGAGGYARADLNARRCTVDWLFNNPETEWVFKRLADITARLNSSHFHFDLREFEAIQLTNYIHDDNGMYGWHLDYGTLVSRKLSIVLQLSDPSEYEGGELQIASELPNSIPKKRGLLVAFPSFSLHQVTPVTSGNRQTLVAWASGPRFK
jgi:PKHD-type hydroxylase